MYWLHFKRLVGEHGNDYALNFWEIQIYGKELAKTFYMSSNVLNSKTANYCWQEQQTP